MNVKPTDGKELWQWDTNRTLTVEGNVSSVRFRYKGSGAIRVPVMDGQAAIPDELLQLPHDLVLWASDENGNTIDMATVPVRMCDRPASYAYTPTEIGIWEHVNERLKELEDYETGFSGKYYLPNISEDGILTFTPSQEGMPEVAPAIVKGPPGPRGAQGPSGAYLPNVTTDDNGRMLGVVDGKWGIVEGDESGIAALAEENDLVDVELETISHKAYLRWSEPEYISISNSAMARWAGTLLVRKEGSAPDNWQDGELLLDSARRNAYQYDYFCDEGLTNGTEYFYQLVPYTENGIYLCRAKNRVSGTPNIVTLPGWPCASGTLVYSGEAQMPGWVNYDPLCMSLSGDITATEVGEYTTVFSLAEDCQWPNGSTDPCSVTWSIQKIPRELSVDVGRPVLTTAESAVTVTVTRAGDDDLTAVSSEPELVSVSVSGNTLTVSAVSQIHSSAAITISLEETEHYLSGQLVLGVLSLFPPAENETLEDYSWEEISLISERGLGSAYFSLGDCKSVSVMGTVGETEVNETFYPCIIGFDYISRGDYVNLPGIFFDLCRISTEDGFRSVALCDTAYSTASTDGSLKLNLNHSEDTNLGGWKGCDARYDILGSSDTPKGNASEKTAVSPVANTLMAALPEDLRLQMKPMTLYTDNVVDPVNKVYNVNTSVEYLPLYAEGEVVNEHNYSNYGEMTRQYLFPYFDTEETYLRYNISDPEIPVMWFSRSPSNRDTYSFCNMTTSEKFYSWKAIYSSGIAPFFRI